MDAQIQVKTQGHALAPELEKELQEHVAEAIRGFARLHPEAAPKTYRRVGFKDGKPQDEETHVFERVDVVVFFHAPEAKKAAAGDFLKA